jgi:thioredoxin reductase (NADPH)
VVGGGNTALGDALYLANICRSVTLIHRRDAFRADRILVDRLAGASNIRTVMNARVQSIEGEARVQTLTLTDTSDHGVSAPMVLQTDGVFVAVGSVPKLSFLSDVEGVSYDPSGYMITDDRCRTDVPGLFAAGDVRSKTLRQIATAVSDGAIAGTEAVEYLDGLSE